MKWSFMDVLAIFLSLISIVLDITFLLKEKKGTAIVPLITHIFMIVIMIVCYFLWRNYYVIFEFLLCMFNGIFIGLIPVMIILICKDD